MIGWGGGLSHERKNVAEAETLGTVEGNMCGIAMRDAVAPPGSSSQWTPSWRETDSNLRFLVARPSTRSWETGLLARKRERICWGTGSSNPSPSSEESGANPALLRALLRHGIDPRITLARSDPISLATLDVLTKLLPPALFSDANLLCLTVCRAVNLSLEHGNRDGSCLCYEKCAALKFGALTDAVRFPGGHRRSVPR